MKFAFGAMILAIALVSCGQSGLNAERSFLGQADVKAETFPKLDGSLSESGDLIILNKIHSTWNGKKLQGNSRLSVIAVE